jgi:sulfide:quinone oxidoreductase
MNELLIAGGGIGALELVLALRGRAAITVIAPQRDFVIRPLTLADPRGARIPLSELAGDLGFRLVAGSVSAVEHGHVVLRAGGTVAYDTLVLAPGARRLPAFENALHIGQDDLEHLTGSATFVAPTPHGWLLPLYEAAMLTARRGVKVTLVTPEEQPLALFGREVSSRVARALEAAGVTRADTAPHGDQIVSLPLLRGPRLGGVPATGAYGLIPIDDHCRVRGLAHVYAIGDATDFPLKQGGIACQMADLVAAQIDGEAVAPLRPTLSATLLTGDGELALGGGRGKLPGRYLAPYLAERAGDAQPPAVTHA